MRLPGPIELDEMADALTRDHEHATNGLKYNQLPVEQRVVVMTLAIAANKMEALEDLEYNMREVSEWFKISRPYEP